MSTLAFTAQAAADLTAAYATPDMVAQRATVLDSLNLTLGERVIDIGCGPGFLCESMARHVGPEGRVRGIDVSPELIAWCRDRDPPSHLNYAEENALALSSADRSFDVVVCTQVAEYIADTTTLLSEVYRVLRPGGRVLVMATDWDCVCWHSDDPDRMGRIMAAWEAHCAHPRLPRHLTALMRAAGFRQNAVQSHPLINTNFAKDTYSFGASKLIETYVTKTTTIPQDEATAWRNELARLDAAGQYYFTSARMIFTACKPD